MNKFTKIFLASILFFGLLLPLNFVYAITQNNQIPVAPEAIGVTEYSITLKEIQGYEYSCDNGNSWQDSNYFGKLEPMNKYTFVQRIKETDTCEYSINSEEVIVETNSLPSKPLNYVPEGFKGIYNIEDLRKVKNDLTGNYILMNDIVGYDNMEEFDPIGSEEEPFWGIFNGNNYSIIGIKQKNNTNLGLFGYNLGSIVNLSVIDSNFQIVEGGEIIKKMGNIAAINYGAIIGCNSKNNIEIDKGTILGGKDSLKDNAYFYQDEFHFGGIVGVNLGKIYFCYFDGKVNITTQEQYSNIGGIAGYNKDESIYGYDSCEIKYCYNLAEIISNNGFCSSVGGICGVNLSQISCTYNIGDIYNNNFNGSPAMPRCGCVGGLLGSNGAYGQLEDSYSLGKVFGQYVYDGMICGYNNEDIDDCYVMYGYNYNSYGYGKEYNCLCLIDFVETSISQGIEKAKEISNYTFPYHEKLGMVNKESNFIDYAGGNGLLNNPFRISNKEHLKNIEKNPYSYYVLTNDIVFNENEIFDPIEEFYGVIDGNGYGIYNLYINDSNEYTGLIRKNDGKILNLDIINPKVYANSKYSGIYAGENSGYIYNCETKSGEMEVKSSYAGAISGSNAGGTIECCSNDNIIKVNSFEFGYVSGGVRIGGLSGEYGTIKKSFNSGDIIINGDASYGNTIGGITNNAKTIVDCYNSGNIYFESDIETVIDEFSGICNYVSYEMKNCYNVGKIEYKSNSKEIKTAGITLSKSNTIKNCYYLNGSIVNNNVGYGTELDDISMKSKSSYKNFDFKNIWQFDTNGEYLYPVLMKPEVSRYETYPTIFGNVICAKMSFKRINVSLLDKSTNEIIFDNGYINEEGYYEINNIKPGNYIISLLKDKETVKSQDVIVENNNMKLDLVIIVKGDVNGDGKIRIYDAFQILKDVLVPGNNLSEIDIQIRDFNGDGQVRIYDAFQFLKQAILS